MELQTLTALLVRLTSAALTGMRTPPENKNADDYFRAEFEHLVLHFAALDGCISADEAWVYSEIAACIDPEMRDTIENNVTFLKGLMHVCGKGPLERPLTLRFIEEFDRENNTTHAAEARTAFFQIALAVASADGTLSADAKAELDRFILLLGST